MPRIILMEELELFGICVKQFSVIHRVVKGIGLGKNPCILQITDTNSEASIELA